MDANLRLRCPHCRAIDWSRDGFTMAVDINGELHPVRVTANHPARAGDASWTCERCGYRPPAEDDLADHLNEMQVAMSR